MSDRLSTLSVCGECAGQRRADKQERPSDGLNSEWEGTIHAAEVPEGAASSLPFTSRASTPMRAQGQEKVHLGSSCQKCKIADLNILTFLITTRTYTLRLSRQRKQVHRRRDTIGVDGRFECERTAC